MIFQAQTLRIQKKKKTPLFSRTGLRIGLLLVWFAGTTLDISLSMGGGFRKSSLQTAFRKPGSGLVIGTAPYSGFQGCLGPKPLGFGPTPHPKRILDPTSLVRFPPSVRGRKRHINIWHKNNFSVTPVTDPPGRAPDPPGQVPGRKCLCSLGSAPWPPVGRPLATRSGDPPPRRGANTGRFGKFGVFPVFYRVFWARKRRKSH